MPFIPVGPDRPVALITGASSGIGQSIALRFAQAGMRVALAARRLDLLEQVAAQVEAAGGSALILPTDVRDPAAIQQMVTTTLQRWERIDVLVANAGVGNDEQSEEALLQQVEVNLLGVVRSCWAVLPAMQRQGRGLIVTIASVAAEVGVPGSGIYSATKAGVLRFTEALGRELATKGIAVSAVLPGFIETAMTSWNKRKMPPPTIVADSVFALLQRPRRRVVVPGWYSMGIGLNRWCPGLVDRVLGPMS